MVPDVVVYLKPDSDTELVICYDFEDNLYSFNISDFKNSVVKLTSIIPADLLGKLRRFKNMDKSDFCWEQGIVISQDLNSSSNFIVNFLTMVNMKRVNPI